MRVSPLNGCAVRDVRGSPPAGGLFVAAAGNAATNNDAAPFYPAAYKLPCVLTVASTTKDNLLSYFSNYGSCVPHSRASYRPITFV